MLHKLQVIFGRVFGACTSSKYIHYTPQFTLQLRHYWLPTMATGKLDSPEFKALLTPDLLRLEKLFTSEGHSLRIVGGAVRDLLLGHSPKDIDMTTECLPDDMLRLLEKEGIRNIPTGLQHGTITAHMDKDYEITTLRIDKVTDGRHAVVEYTNDWKLDSERRDLTINSMSVSLDGTLYDYFEGQRHLAERRVLFVGDSRERIKEDYLRILRYFRFFSRISQTPNDHDQDTLVAIKENADGLKKISVERIWMEVKRILTGKYAPTLLELMYELGVSENINLPPHPNITEFTSVWSRLQSQPQYLLQPISLLVTLVVSPNQAEELARQWKLSNSERQLGIFIAKHRIVAYKETTPLKYFQDLLVDKSLKEHVIEVLRYCGRGDDADYITEWKIPVLPVTGNELIQAGVPPGSKMGKVLKLMKEKWKDSYYSLTQEELLEMALKIH